MKENNSLALSTDNLKSRIYTIRGMQVMLDEDLAELYSVKTKVLNQAVKRNMRRFPEDFMFKLDKHEFNNLRSQIVTSKRGGTTWGAFVFTEQGVAMLSGVLTSPRAVEVNIAIMRAFVRLRRIISTHKELAQKLAEYRKQQAEAIAATALPALG